MDSSDEPPSGGFRDLRVWHEAIALADDVDALARTFPAQRANLADQLQRASRSVHANIAEGSGRKSGPEFARFLDYSRGSLREVESDIRTLVGLGLATQVEVDRLERRTMHVGRLLAGLLRHLRDSDA
jgi:four helix bundle protein